MPGHNWVPPSSGGSVSDGSITTAKLADLAATTAKLGDNARLGGSQPSGALAQTFRIEAASASAPLTGGTLHLAYCPIVAGRQITAINIIPSSASSGLTSTAAYLIDVSNSQIVAASADSTTAWTTAAARTFTLTSPYTPTQSAFWIGVHAAASTTVPGGRSCSLGTNVAAVPTPSGSNIYRGATANTGLTAALTVGTTIGGATAAGTWYYFYLT